MKSFKKCFYDLIDSYKKIPCLDECVNIQKNNITYRVRLEIKELYNSKKKPTHKTVEKLIQYMENNKVDWIRCDDPANDPQLFCFSNLDNKNLKFCSISISDLEKSKITADQILKKVNPDVY